MMFGTIAVVSQALTYWSMACPSGNTYDYPYPAPGFPNQNMIDCLTENLTPTPPTAVITLTPALTEISLTRTAAAWTPTPSRTATIQPSETVTLTPTPTFTLIPTWTNTPTDISTPTDTATPTYTLTFTPSPSETPTLTFTPLPPTNTPSPTPIQAPILVDHTSVALFDQIPAQYLDAARNTKFLFSDRSVGDNIDLYLNCLQSATSWASSPNYCRKDSQTPARILFNPDPTLYNRSNWTHMFESGNYYYDITQYWIQSIVMPNINNYDVFLQQFSYLATDNGSNIANYFLRTDPNHFNIVNYEGLISANPNKKFVFSTTSLARIIGTPESDAFNTLMRQYASDTNQPLFDMADIESHDGNGAPCSYNGHPAICPTYTTETSGGHLGSYSEGGIRIVKAIWVLMAELNGWKP